MIHKNLRILAISGSLRAHSSNTHILKTLVQLAPPQVLISLYEGLGSLPHFNPDIEKEEALPVNHFRQQLKDADGVIICTPEYAFGVPGVLKNALDWAVGSGEFNDKPVAAISASPLVTGGDKAMASLLLTLKALGTKMTEKSSLSLPAISKKINAQGIVTDVETKQQLDRFLKDFIQQMEQSLHPASLVK